MSLRVLLVNTTDRGGGAESVTRQLLRQLPSRGVEPQLAIGRRVDSAASNLVDLGSNQFRQPWARVVVGSANRIASKLPGSMRFPRLKRLVRKVTEPGRQRRIDEGFEDFDFPGSHRLLRAQADVVHLHNLHGNYFDLRILPELSNRVPTAVTLHDQWMFTGHCAYSLDCERWAGGCGLCPHLDTYPAVPLDRTAENLAAKRNIYSDSHLHISAPTQWLLDQAERSVLSEGMASARMIRLGIDLDVFHPVPKDEAKLKLQLDPGTPLVVFSANRARSNPFKGWSTALSAFDALGADHRLDVVCLGDDGPDEKSGGVRVRYVGRVVEPDAVADWYRAANVFVHAAWSDNSPLAVIEAQACGTPVVAPEVGGIPEIVLSAGTSEPHGQSDQMNLYEGPTGLLVEPRSPADMATALSSLLLRPDISERMGVSAARYASSEFGLDRYIDQTVEWYREMTDHWPGRIL